LQHGGVEGGEGGRSIEEEEGIGSAHRKWMARQGWWLFGPISARGGGLGARAPSRRARGVKKGGAWTVRVWSGKERGDRAAMEALIAMRDRGWRPWVHPHGGGKRMGGFERGRCMVSCAGSSPRAAVPSHTWERQGKGERELAGGQARGVGPTYQ
jgi:hypothetical protein